jgi:hypothetical protein
LQSYRFFVFCVSDRETVVKNALITLLFVTLAATGAAAQEVNLSGRYRCAQNCSGPGPAYVTQSGWDLNLVNEAGVPSRAWIDWAGHIWAESWREGAVFSPDGKTIQFDNGAVWQRDATLPPMR